jgi:hypothetical protein
MKTVAWYADDIFFKIKISLLAVGEKTENSIGIKAAFIIFQLIIKYQQADLIYLLKLLFQKIK